MFHNLPDVREPGLAGTHRRTMVVSSLSLRAGSLLCSRSWGPALSLLALGVMGVGEPES